MAAKKTKKPYYYAAGKRVVLDPADDLIAVDDERLAEKLPDLLSDAALRAGKPLRGGVRLLERAALTPETQARLLSAGVTAPVFRKDGAIMVALPEVRVEDNAEAKLAEVRKFAASKKLPIIDDADGRLTLQPVSGEGGDSLSLSSQLVEQYKLASASPRFLRVVPGPVVRT